MAASERMTSSAGSGNPTSAGAWVATGRLTLDACLAAIRHAGLDVRDIDGLSTYPAR
jgi:hypothetical protein